jgi:RHH-type transcriptional regulator, proline utilization regulon repressor / proline dehydrogenase / delta 1-pyrroline-5-carboxylate dehydrogenase
MKMDLSQAYTLLEKAKAHPVDLNTRVERAIELAKILVICANKIQTRQEFRQMAQLNELINDPEGKAFTNAMTDECFRSQSNRRVANQIIHLLKVHGTPKYLDAFSRFQMTIFKFLGENCAAFLIPMVKELIRKETEMVILPGESETLKKHLLKRKAEGITTNLNHLGEAILGEAEALKRLNTYIDDLKKNEIEYISIKISTIYSQLSMLSKKTTIDTLKERLRILYRAAMQYQYIDGQGHKKNKFINLDMEEFRDLSLTLSTFKEVLSEKEFLNFRGGVVLQAYLPDSFAALEDLTQWALKRYNNGGSAIKVRLVKGANLAMEKIEASSKLWPQAPFSRKIEVDAHYRKMVNFALNKDHAFAVNIGIASHNIFDVAYALLLKYEQDIFDYVNFEMLEGMAEHLRLVVQELSQGMILYCPAAGKDEFQNAIAYLIRRLDENTAPDNFLRHIFNLKENSSTFKQQAEFFKEGCQLINSINSTPKRQQNRLKTITQEELHSNFTNEADTDFSLPQNYQWAQNIYAELESVIEPTVPLIINGEVSFSEKTRKGICPNTAQAWGSISLATTENIETALLSAQEDFVSWSQTDVLTRTNIIQKAAHLLRQQRAQLITTMIIETGKTLSEADTEISEAIDFCDYYSRNLIYWSKQENLSFTAIGPTLITSPWNFPCAIPVGGISAALCAGNSVIFKPAPEAAITGWYLAQIFHQAGVSPKTLQFINCDDDPEGSALIKSDKIKACILTGATDTAKLFMTMNPKLNLMAETGGKNCIIATDMADRDLLIKDVIHSAFGHAGQKCSACSLLILEKEIYDDSTFLSSLKDAAASLKVGLSSAPETIVNPLIQAPQGKLHKALTRLEEGEQWLLEPRVQTTTPHLWSPAIKLGVTLGSYTFDNEFFGPVLGVVRAKNLDHAIQIANSLDYGLTGGLHSLDNREQEKWLAQINVGNAYINRTITGAIVQRQPFGGFNNSAFGRGLKAGGENYLLQLMNISENQPPQSERTPLPQHLKYLEKHIKDHLPKIHKDWLNSTHDYLKAYRQYFSQFSDPSQILGQENYTLYKPIAELRLFCQEQDSILDIYRIIAACLICNSPLKIVIAPESHKKTMLDTLSLSHMSISPTEKDHFPQGFLKTTEGRNRFISPLPDIWLASAAKKFAFVQANPVFASGRLELLHYLRASSVSDTYHRYGNLGNKKKH